MRSPTAAMEEALSAQKMGQDGLSLPPQVEAKRERPLCDSRACQGAFSCFCANFSPCVLGVMVVAGFLPST